MKAGPIEIGRLLQNRQRFCVPIYQRHYVWSRERQWEPFWNDVRTKAIECLNGRERRFSHFMGAVVLETRGGFSAGRVPAFQVVDGQQRLTTFQLFLAAARDYALATSMNDTADQIKSYLLNDKPHLMEDPEVETYKVWPTQADREMFMDILQLSRTELRKKYSEHFYKRRDQIYSYRTVPRLLGGYGYFFDQIKYAVESDDLEDEFAEAPDLDHAEDEESVEGEASSDELRIREIRLDGIWRALVEEFKIVEITLEEGDDAQVIFETLNERGEPLLAADLVRNNIFHRADAVGENADKLFAKHWKDFEDDFWSVEEKQGRYKKPRIEFFLANFIAGQIAGEVNLTKLFSEYKAFLKRSTRIGGPPKFATVADELRELERYGGIYRAIIDRNTPTALASFAKKLHLWDVTTVYPLVMRLWDSDMEADEKAQSLAMLLSFIVRRAVCGLTTKNYNKYFLSVVASLDKNEWSVQALREFMMAQTSDTARFPDDSEFEHGWLTIPVYQRLKTARVRAVLEEIERAKRTQYQETDQLKPNLTVEHIMPQNWRKEWPMDDGTAVTPDEMLSALYSDENETTLIGKIARRERLKETFGNLTLLTQPLNSSVSNGLFAGKQQALQEQSLLVLSKELQDEETWDESRIIARGEKLFVVAKGLWPAL